MDHKRRKKQKNNSQEKYGAKLVDSFSPEDLFDDCLVCQAEKAATGRGRPLTKKELEDAFQRAKEKGDVVGGNLFQKERDSFPPEELRPESINAAGNFTMPQWMECTWKRIPCRKDECKICGKIKHDQLQHIIRGENPDNTKSTLEDVGNSLTEALLMIKKHAEELGIDLTNIGEDEFQEPPKPEHFPIYRKVEKWQSNIEDIAQEAETTGAPWILTEAAADLFWYKNTLSAKVYRQLCNRWHLDRGDKYGEFDYQYTKYVLGECLSILKQALSELVSPDISTRSKFAVTASRLDDLSPEILNI